MSWRRRGANTAGRDDAPPERPLAIDCLTTRGAGSVGWPLAGSVREWRHHMVARVKVVQWYHDEDGVKHEEDFGGYGPWEEFAPFNFMAGCYSQHEEQEEDEEDEPPHYGTTITLQTSWCYPWRIVWRSRMRQLDEEEWEYHEHSDDIGPNNTYEIELDAEAGTRNEFFDSMILVPA